MVFVFFLIATAICAVLYVIPLHLAGRWLQAERSALRTCFAVMLLSFVLTIIGVLGLVFLLPPSSLQHVLGFLVELAATIFAVNRLMTSSLGRSIAIAVLSAALSVVAGLVLMVCIFLVTSYLDTFFYMPELFADKTNQKIIQKAERLALDDKRVDETIVFSGIVNLDSRAIRKNREIKKTIAPGQAKAYVGYPVELETNAGKNYKGTLAKSADHNVGVQSYRKGGRITWRFKLDTIRRLQVLLLKKSTNKLRSQVTGAAPGITFLLANSWALDSRLDKPKKKQMRWFETTKKAAYAELTVIAQASSSEKAFAEMQQETKHYLEQLDCKVTPLKSQGQTMPGLKKVYRKIECKKEERSGVDMFARGVPGNIIRVNYTVFDAKLSAANKKTAMKLLDSIQLHCHEGTGKACLKKP